MIDALYPHMHWAWEGWSMAFIHAAQLSCALGWIASDE